MTRLGCTCDNIVKGKPFSAGQCPHCWAFHHVREINLARGGDGVVAVVMGGKDQSDLVHPCIYRADTGRSLAHATCIDGCPGGIGSRQPVRRCTLKGECTIAVRARKEDGTVPACCRDCKERVPRTQTAKPPTPQPARKVPVLLPGKAKLPVLETPIVYGPQGKLEWISTRQLTADTLLLAAKLPPNLAGIAGIPRSGMIPASILAAHLHVPLYQFADGALLQLANGSRGRILGYQAGGGRIAIVDDTVYSGAEMRKAREAISGRWQKEALFAAVYVRPETADVVDTFVRELASPHLLEWNLMNGGPFTGLAKNPIYGAGVACDFDGIFCHDAESGGELGTPYLVPKILACRLIVTGRRERDRAVTEAWLRAHGAKWESLTMLPDDADGSIEGIAAHKAKHYAASKCGFFVESCPQQAEMIFKETQKPVICPRIERVFQ